MRGKRKNEREEEKNKYKNKIAGVGDTQKRKTIRERDG